MFDVNIFLDVAQLVGEPYSIQKFDEMVARNINHPVPHSDPAYDSLRAIATCTTGNFDGKSRLEVWTSDHIDELTYIKATHPTYAQVEEDRGLGWSMDSAQGLVDELVGRLVFDLSAGNSVGEVNISYGAPPLSHEDGCVYATARNAGTEEYFYRRYCVTRDKKFLLADLPGDIEVMNPSEWVAKVRAERRMASIRQIVGGTKPKLFTPDLAP